jgi:hypothetical protein
LGLSHETRMVQETTTRGWCSQCLAKHPKATFGQRLKSYRLAASMMLVALQKQRLCRKFHIYYIY